MVSETAVAEQIKLRWRNDASLGRGDLSARAHLSAPFRSTASAGTATPCTVAPVRARASLRFDTGSCAPLGSAQIFADRRLGARRLQPVTIDRDAGRHAIDDDGGADLPSTSSAGRKRRPRLHRDPVADGRGLPASASRDRLKRPTRPPCRSRGPAECERRACVAAADVEQPG